MFQKVLVIGRLGTDPELRTVSQNNTVCNFTIAASEKFKARDGQSKENTEWFKCVAWGKTGEVIQQYCGKGSLLQVEGKMKTRSWETKDGVKRYSTELMVDGFTFLEKKKENVGGPMFDSEQEIPF